MLLTATRIDDLLEDLRTQGLTVQATTSFAALEIVLSTPHGRRGSLRIGSLLLDDPDVDRAFGQIRTMILEVAYTLVDLPAEAADASIR